MNDVTEPKAAGAEPPSDPIAARIDRALHDALARGAGPASPPNLQRALGYSVFPGGKRVRPSLCISVALGCGDSAPARANAAAAAVELVHCASLVHDDLPTFDAAALRRGRPTTHAAFGAPTAVLAGDALLVLAFDTLARVGAARELLLLTTATGPAVGVIAGQAWEYERSVSIDDYHCAKTARLFGASAGMGALAAGGSVEPWVAFGEVVGCAYQVADDLIDATLSAEAAGKCTGRDEALGRPSCVRQSGVDASRRRLLTLTRLARASVPSCVRPHHVHEWLDRLERKMGAG